METMINGAEPKVKLLSDSSADLKIIDGCFFSSVPLTVSTDKKDYIDSNGLDVHAMLNELAKYDGRSFTACPGVELWTEQFGDADIIFVVTMTSGLSGTYNSACAAAKLYLQSHPEAKIHVFDTLSTGPEQRLLVKKIDEWIKAGLSFDEIVSLGNNYMKKTRLFFCLQSLHNFAQNGRVSKVTAAAVGVLGIRIVGTASSEGTLEVISKSRGEKKAKNALLEQLAQAGYNGGKMALCHIENPELASSFKNSIIELDPDADIEIYPAGGLCSYYAERGGLLIGIECEK